MDFLLICQKMGKILYYIGSIYSVFHKVHLGLLLLRWLLKMDFQVVFIKGTKKEIETNFILFLFLFFFRFVVWLVFNIIISGGAYHVQNGNISREAVTITSTPIVHNAQTVLYAHKAKCCVTQ